MQDLFTPDRQFVPIAMPDAAVSILHGIAMPLSYDAMLQKLQAEIEWRQESVRIFGKVHAQPRLVALYGDPAARYVYSGLTLYPLPWTKLLLAIKQRVEACCAAQFNAVFLNLYRDHNDSMGYHSDDEPELGENPVIASLSFGATRNLLMRHRFQKTQPLVRLPLAAGTVLVMQGPTQHYWKHGINKQAQPCGPRINLTFRSIRR